MLSGGCPIAAAELATQGLVPEFVVEMVKDWVLGECSRSGRNRSALLGVFQALVRHGTTPCGQAKVAREAGLANNTVAAGYLELLMDLMCLATTYAWDKDRNIALRHRPAKFHFVILPVALAWHPDRPLSVEDFLRLSPQTQGQWYEWLVAQELWRRAALRGDEFPEVLSFWQSKTNEIDFVDGDRLIEVKRGSASPLDFAWFPKVFPGRLLTVVNTQRFETAFCKGITLRDFLLEHA
jgi:predicted AAA+ superfamily ATPase